MRRSLLFGAVAAAVLIAGVGTYVLVHRQPGQPPGAGVMGGNGPDKPRDAPAESACEAIWQTPPDLYDDPERMAAIAVNGHFSTRNPGVKAAADELGDRADDALKQRVAEPARSLELYGAAVRFGTACVEAGYGKPAAGS